MTKIIFYLTILLVLACDNKKPLNQFSLVLYDYDYAMAYSKKYVLTDKDLNIVFRGELEGEKDSILFSTQLKPTADLRTLSQIDFGMLRDNYKNDCVDDGYQISIVFTGENQVKTIHLSNYHQEDVAFAIELINKIVPEKYQIYYNQDELIESMEGCNN